MRRRYFLSALGVAGLGITGQSFWPENGIVNKCSSEDLPQLLAEHDLVKKAWEGINASNVWDCHCHLIGTGDSGSGIWVNPNMESLGSPVQYAQFKFYLNAACVDNKGGVDQSYIDRLILLNQNMRPGFKYMLLAFDYHHDKLGKRVLEYSPFYTPNEYAASVAARYPAHFEWIASIHPYREDCVEALEKSVAKGARAVKWLPGAMGIDPASPLCDRFYDALVKHEIPLLAHAGSEHAVHVPGTQHLGNPLLLRRALERGVRVIVAHCASTGSSEDGERKGVSTHNYQLFKRLMQDKNYEGRLYGDISAVTQINRDIEVIEDLLKQTQWHHRFLFGSDYPLPGVMPIFSTRYFVRAKLLKESHADFLNQLRPYNPMLFDFMLKRLIRYKGHAFSTEVFETRKVFHKNVI